MNRGEGRWPGRVAGSRRLRLLAAVLVAAVLAAPAVARELAWRPLAVEARLDADGALWVRESHTMVFTGDWNGGERSFRLGLDQSLELHGIARLDPATGEELPLVRGSLSRVDQYDWLDRRTLRWRSRLPADPPFAETAITYLIEYRQERVLEHRAGRYRLDHDFAFADRIWPVEGFTLDLVLDPVWRPVGALAGRHGPQDLLAGQSYLVTAELEYLGEGRPASVRHLPPLLWRAVPFAGAVLAIVALVVGFRRREAELGRFDPPPSPSGIDSGWLAEHLFNLLPEEAGTLWDRKVGPPEVAAILARWEAEGRIESEVVPRKSRFRKDILRLKLLADHDTFDGYEGRLVKKLFFGGRREVDTAAIRKRYRRTGFDPAATVRRSIERRLRRRDRKLMPRKRSKGARKAITVGLLLVFLAALLVEGLQRPLLTLQLALLLLAPLVALYLILGLIFAYVYRRRLDRLGGWALGFGLPGALFLLVMVVLAFFDRLLLGVDFAPQPGMAGTLGLAVLAVLVWSSLLNNASSRERPVGLRRRQQLLAARRLFAGQLARQQPDLVDEWMPYLLALGLGPRVDRWWKRFGGTVGVDAMPAHRFGSSSSGSGSGWTGGGGGFGGAGATASWAAVAGSVASGVAKPGSSGSSGGGGGGGGGSSGGGGGGGW